MIIVAGQPCGSAAAAVRPRMSLVFKVIESAPWENFVTCVGL